MDEPNMVDSSQRVNEHAQPEKTPEVSPGGARKSATVLPPSVIILACEDPGILAHREDEEVAVMVYKIY